MIHFDTVSFTGTQEGMTERQLLAVFSFLILAQCERGHHGDCIGADAQFHKLCQVLRTIGPFHITLHPPDNDAKRARCTGADAVLPTAPYLMRNHDVVDAGDVLLATPKEHEETLRSGTWATIRYARTKNPKPICIVWPDGTCDFENWPKEEDNTH